MSKNQIKKTTEQQKNTTDSELNKAQSPEEKSSMHKAAEQKVNVMNDKVVNDKSVNNKTDKAQTKRKESDKKTEHKESKPIESKQIDIKDKPVKKSSSFFARFKWVMIWLIVFVAIAAAVLFTRKDLDWQIQHINDLQAKVTQLNQAQQALEARIDTQLKETELRLLAKVEAEIKTKEKLLVQSNISSKLAPEQQAIVTQGDIDKVQQATQQQLSQLQKKISTLGEQAVQQTQQVFSGVSELAETTKQALQPTPETKKALVEIEKKLQTQLTQVGNKLVELFEFKSEQQALANQAAESQPVEKQSLEQFKHWVIEVNTQWLLRGNVAETHAQLTALQQAIAVSPMPNTASLASLIGQDKAYLEHYQTQQAQDKLNTNALKQAIQSLSAEHTEQENSTAVNSASQQQGGGNISNNAETATGLTFDSAVEQLKHTLGSMVSIKKRDSEAEITQVESLILQDVLVQRALLLVDRIDWAIVSQSNTLLERSVHDLQLYIDRTFSRDSDKFKTLLSPFSSYQFDVRQPLIIRDWLANQE
ncbi:hypothetical protein MNBD_GAMMA03-1769 [hydrothermal vent metagenome]|uniref:Uroporphyrinogen-III C-methyltransferase n=1 Tax=hydrothermal vent metagenome TaxID=652676 RepID=A0A3B0W176_9ZZZZ